MKSDDNRNNLGPKLLEAIRLQDVERVRALLTAGADPNTRERDRIYVYHHGYMPTSQETALTLACDAITEARIVIVRLLLDCGADPEARNGKGLNAGQVTERTRKAAATRRRATWLREQVDLLGELKEAAITRVFA